MLQRIQSVWTLLAAICAALTFKFSFYSGNKAVDVTGHRFTSVTATSSVLILLVTVIITAAALINIFNYKNRRRQIWINIGLIVLSLLNIFLYFKESQGFVEGKYDLTAVLSFVIPILFILAVRGIMKDDKIVKSADRLR
jgi:multisubunit Na+/H+ antiporter MnhB subunit